MGDGGAGGLRRVVRRGSVVIRVVSLSRRPYQAKSDCHAGGHPLTTCPRSGLQCRCTLITLSLAAGPPCSRVLKIYHSDIV